MFSPKPPANGFAATQILPPDGEPDPVAWPLPDDSMPMPLADDSAPAPLDLLPPADADPTIGHVGRYALKHRVGAGGLGNVYTAWDPILSRNLAIKTLHVSGVHRDTLDALILDEARAIARLNHPHIVTVFDAGLSERGVYIAMEQLPGCDLRQLLDEDWRPDALRAAKLARRVGEALAYSHHHGVIHCDIKPANIFMVDRRKPKVLDFGIARVAQRPQVRGMEGLVTGSPHYLAPEQLRNGPVDVRTDVYALGVVMYELLTGMKAFPGTRLEQITDSVLRGQAVPAHERVPGVSPELSAICAKAMALAPSQRYASAKEFVYALREWQVRHSSPARPSANAAAAAARPAATRQVPTRPVFPTSEADERAHRAARRRRLGWAAAAVIAMLGGTALWVAAN